MWHYLFVAGYMEVGLKSLEIKNELIMLMAASANMNLCVFSHYDKKANGAHMYFSPGTELIAKKHGAKLCDPPKRDEVGEVLHGNADNSFINSLFS